MSKKQHYYTLRKDYTIKVEKWNKISDKVQKEKDNEIARLRKMVANNHHMECGCSFCRGVGFIYGGAK